MPQANSPEIRRWFSKKLPLPHGMSAWTHSTLLLCNWMNSNVFFALGYTAAPTSECTCPGRIFAADSSETRQPDAPAKNIMELFAPLRGLNLDVSRNSFTGRPVDL